MHISSDENDPWQPAPAEVQVVFQPFGLWERLAPPAARYVHRIHARLARKELNRVLKIQEQKSGAKKLASPEQAAADKIPPELPVQAPAKHKAMNLRPPRQCGFRADMQKHTKIAKIIQDNAPIGDLSQKGWKSEDRLKVITKKLDEAGIEIPESWKKGIPKPLDNTSVTSWSEALEYADKKLVVDAIRYWTSPHL